MKMKIFLLSLLLAFSSTICSALTEEGQCEFNGINYAKASQFVTVFKSNINKNDKKAISELISYPLRVNTAPGKFYLIKDKHEFVAKYNKLFNQETIQALKNNDHIFCNYQGAMIGSGIWFNTENQTAKIFAINP